MATSIEWTDVTDNIITAQGGGWWCRKISPGCLHCYAARINNSSYYGGNKMSYTGDAPPLVLRREFFDRWKRQKKAKRHFVASMTDVFGEWVPPEWSFEMLDAMAAAPLQTFQVLTKRPGVARRYIAAWLDARGLEKLPPNIWIGTSVEDQARADERIPELLEIPAYVRFLSCEPLLGPVNISHIRKGDDQWFPMQHLHWIIAGGESGKGKDIRPVNPDWARSIRDQCQRAGVPFLFKQWGEWVPCDFQGGPAVPGATIREVRNLGRDGVDNNTRALWPPGNVCMQRIGKKAAGRQLDGRTWDEFPSDLSAVSAVSAVAPTAPASDDGRIGA